MRGLFACALALALSPCAMGCEPTPGTPIVDTGAFAGDDGGGDDVSFDATPPDTTPPDLGIYDAPSTPDGNCELFPADGDVQVLQCDPGTTCDVTGFWPLCARSEDGGIACGDISCIGLACRDGHCVGFND